MKEQHYRRQHKTVVWHDSPFAPGEPGDVMVDDRGNLFRLCDTNEYSGHLRARHVKPPWKGAKAVMRKDGTKKPVNHWPGMNEKRVKLRMGYHKREVWWISEAAFEKSQNFK